MTERTGHWITPTIDAGIGVRLKVTCYEPEGAECRQIVVKESNGWLRVEDGMVLAPEPPVTEDCGYCTWEDFYASVGGEEDYYEGPDGHPVIEGPISIRLEPPRGEDDGGAFCWMYIEEGS